MSGQPRDGRRPLQHIDTCAIMAEGHLGQLGRTRPENWPSPAEATEAADALIGDGLEPPIQFRHAPPVDDEADPPAP